MPPFFLDVWMEIAQNQGKTKMVDKKTLFFIPVNDNTTVSRPAEAQTQSAE
jgi:hypothetical protein